MKLASGVFVVSKEQAEEQIIKAERVINSIEPYIEGRWIKL